MRRPLEIIRTVWFWTTFVFVTVVMSTGWLLIFPFTTLFDRDRHLGHYLSCLWAAVIVGLQPWWRVRIRGKEHLARPGEGVIYVANHRHEADILMLFLLRTRFRWLSKMSVFHVPVLGWSMWATGYVGVVRGNHQSHVAARDKSLAFLRRGVPMLFFPEGTFGRGEELRFKQGAFRLAQEAGVPIVPVSIRGTDALFRDRRWVAPGRVEIEVLPGIPTRGKIAAEIAEETRERMLPALALRRIPSSPSSA